MCGWWKVATKRVKRADERIQGLAWFMCIYTLFFAFAIFLLLFFGFGTFVCVVVERRQLNPNRESKDSSMDAFVCLPFYAVLFIRSAATIKTRMNIHKCVFPTKLLLRRLNRNQQILNNNMKVTWSELFRTLGVQLWKFLRILLENFSFFVKL